MGDIVRKLHALGVDPVAMADILDSVAVMASENAVQPPIERTARQDRNRRYYERKRLNKTESDVLTPPMKDHSTPPEKLPPSPPTEVQAPRGSSRKANGSLLSDDWQPKARHFEWGASKGFDRSKILVIAETMREWAKANSNRPLARKADWDATFGGWLRREAEKTQPARAPPQARQTATSVYANMALRGMSDEPSDNQFEPEILPPDHSAPPHRGFGRQAHEPDRGGPWWPDGVQQQRRANGR